MKDIAKVLNISIATVSRALREMPEIHADTRRAVMRVAEELDYQPNQLAKNLVNSRTRTIGVIVPNLSYYFFSALLNSIEEAAMQTGYSVMICQSNESSLREKTHVQNLMRSQVEGFIISLPRDTSNCEHVERLVRRNVPVVLVDRHTDSLEAFKVVVDNYDASYKVTKHLIDNGCQRIACLAGPPQLLISNQRIAGYKDALTAHGLPVIDEYILHCDYTQESTIMQTLRLMSLATPPDGLLTISDQIAYSAIYALRQKNVRIPDDLTIASFNNEPFSALLSPTLTSVSQPIQQMGVEAMRLLLMQIDSGDAVLHPQTTVMNTQLVVRESSVRSLHG